MAALVGYVRLGRGGCRGKRSGMHHYHPGGLLQRCSLA